jgi:hypothetical protein
VRGGKGGQARRPAPSSFPACARANVWRGAGCQTESAGFQVSATPAERRACTSPCSLLFRFALLLLQRAHKG